MSYQGDEESAETTEEHPMQVHLADWSLAASIRAGRTEHAQTEGCS